jgi:hypothetical protein
MIPHALKRFVFLAIPALMLVMALFHFGLEMVHLDLAGALSAKPGAPTAWLVAATWFLEALALTAFFLLLEGRAGDNRWLTGVLAGWIAWVFRGPLLVVSVATLAALPVRPWWNLALSWWVAYTVCGLVLAALAGPGPESV